MHFGRDGCRAHTVSHAATTLPTVEAPVAYANEVPPTHQRFVSAAVSAAYLCSSPARPVPVTLSIHKYESALKVKLCEPGLPDLTPLYNTVHQ